MKLLIVVFTLLYIVLSTIICCKWIDTEDLFNTLISGNQETRVNLPVADFTVSWRNPLPQGNHLRGVWGTSSKDIFAVGQKGTIIHYDGDFWELMDSGTDLQLNDIWGTSPHDVFACGYNIVLHYDGIGWTKMEGIGFGFFTSIWAHEPDDVFMVGDDNIYHYNGEHWANVTSDSYPMLRGVFGFTSDNVYVVGDGGIILHYDGNNWTHMEFTLNREEDYVRRNNLFCVWGSSPDQIIAGGEVQLFFNGTTWREMDGTNNFGLQGIWGTSINNVYAAGSTYIMHYNGISWRGRDYLDTTDIFGFSTNDVFAVGNNGLILHYNGYSWSPMTGVVTNTVSDIWGSAQSELFAAGSSFYTSPVLIGSEPSVLHSDGQTWAPILARTNSDERLRGIWGTSSTDVFAVGGKEPYCEECDNKNVGQSRILHYDGVSWFYQSTGTTGWLEDVWGTSSENVYAAGHNGLILHYDGISWQTMESGTSETLYGIWGFSPTEIYAVGSGGIILRYDGKKWRTVESYTSKTLYGIWGDKYSHVYIAGNGLILIFDNKLYSTLYSFNESTLYDIQGTSSSELFAVGESGTIFYFNHGKWYRIISGTPNDLTGIWIDSNDEIFVSGDGGTILQISN